MRIQLAYLVFSVVLLATIPAFAQPAALPDIVQLRDGSYVRGTIVERVEGQYVTIQLAGGDLRQFPFSEVTYAGAAADEVPQPPAQTLSAQPALTGPTQAVPTPQPGSVQLQVVPARADQRFTLHVLTGSATATVWTGGGVGFARVDSFAPVCTAPCSTNLPPGSYFFGVSQGDGEARRAPGGPFTVDRNMLTAEIEYESREGFRIAGWLWLGIGAVAGLTIMLIPLFGNDYDNYEVPLIVGASIAVGSSLGSLPLLLFNDAARVRFDGL